MRAAFLSLVIALGSLGLATFTPAPAKAAVPPAVYTSSFEPVAWHGWRGWRGGSHYRGYWGGYRPYWGGYYGGYSSFYRPYWGGYYGGWGYPAYSSYYYGGYPAYSSYYGAYPYGGFVSPWVSVW